MEYKVAVVMGSDSDYAVMKEIIPVLQDGGVDYDFRVISAHRTPEIATAFARDARKNGYDLIIAGAGMSAHLGGVLAACTGVPVIGVPILSEASGMDGMDALHSVIQMPPGIPVAAVGIDQAAGAARLALRMIDGARWTDETEDDAKTVLIFANSATDTADIEKTTKALAAYGILWAAIDISNMSDETAFFESLNTYEHAFACINLQDADCEGYETLHERLPNALIIEVPRKAQSRAFNATSDKVYQQTKNANGVAFVGVHSYQNAAHLAARILGIHSLLAYDAVVAEHAKLAAAVMEKDAKLQKEVNESKK